MWTKSRSLLLSRVMIGVFILALIGAVIVLPDLLRSSSNYPYDEALSDPWPGGRYESQGGERAPEANAELEQGVRMFTLWLRLSAVPAFTALICLHFLLRNISRDRVFVDGNVSLIRAVSWCCMAVAFIFLALAIAYAFLTGYVIAAILGFVGLVLRVVKNVIAQAIELKNENDLTV